MKRNFTLLSKMYIEPDTRNNNNLALCIMLAYKNT